MSVGMVLMVLKKNYYALSNNKTNFISLSFIFILTLLIPLQVLVAGDSNAGDGKGSSGGNGDGSGGRQKIAFSMQQSTPEDGAVNVEACPEISCVFTHNVTVGELGKKNFSLLSLENEAGETVEIETWVEDAQTDPDQRQILYLRPQEELPEGKYTVRLGAGIEAKNGMVSESDESFEFTVGEGAAAAATKSKTPMIICYVIIAVACVAVVVILVRGRKKR